jgi:hypothetical protein
MIQFLFHEKLQPHIKGARIAEQQEGTALQIHHPDEQLSVIRGICILSFVELF